MATTGGLNLRLFIYYYFICIEYTYFVFGDIAETLTTIASGVIVVDKAQEVQHLLKILAEAARLWRASTAPALRQRIPTTANLTGKSTY